MSGRTHPNHVVKGLIAQQSICGKHVYRSEAAVLRGIAQENRGRKERGLEPRQLRPYYCANCGHWHATRKGAKGYWLKRRQR